MKLILGAQRILAGGSSAFHKTGAAAVSFLRAVIGFETATMKEGNQGILGVDIDLKPLSALSMLKLRQSEKENLSLKITTFKADMTLVLSNQEREINRQVRSILSALHFVQ